MILIRIYTTLSRRFLLRFQPQSFLTRKRLCVKLWQSKQVNIWRARARARASMAGGCEIPVGENSLNNSSKN